MQRTIGRIVWGDQIDTAVVIDEDDGRRTQLQLISASTPSKGSNEARRARPPSQVGGVPRDISLPEHLRRLAETAWALAEQPTLSAQYHLQLWAHTCGFRGHFAHQYAVLLDDVRRPAGRTATLATRCIRARPRRRGSTVLDDGTSSFHEWSYEGSGYLTAGDACLARNLEDELRLGRSVAREEGAAGSAWGAASAKRDAGDH